MKKPYFLLVGITILLSCKNTNNVNSKKFINKDEVKYASGFAIETLDGQTKIEVFNPWENNAVLAKYVFTTEIGYQAAEDEIVVKAPIKKAAYLSSTYLAMVAMLNGQKSVAAATKANWINDSLLYQMYKQGNLKDLGNGMQLDAEKIIGIKPDAIMKYIYQVEEPVDKTLSSLGIPVVYNIEFMETHPLGRAEWIKVVGAFLGKEKEADSVFNLIETQYNRLKSLAENAKTEPSVIDGSSFKGTWYVPGGKSFVAQLLQDAHSRYYWQNDTTQGSIPVSFEVVLKEQGKDDFWINANASSLNEILAVESRCELLNAFKKGNVYHFNKRKNPEGGLDYYESGVVRPDLILHDLLVILHPELFAKSQELYYYKKLE